MAHEDKEGREVWVAYDNEALLQTTHMFIRSYIKVIDRKASILLTILLAVLGILGNALRVGAIRLGSFGLAMVGLAIFCGVISLILAAWVVYPRANIPDDRGYIYWEKIRRFDDPESLSLYTMRLPDHLALYELARDTYTISQIAHNKYEWLRRAVKSAFAGGIFASVAIFNSIFNNIHNISPELNGPIYQGERAIIASILSSLILFTIISYIIKYGDTQVDSLHDLWFGGISRTLGED